jgi:vitamin B12 transporter
VRFDNKIRGFMTNTTLPRTSRSARIDGWTWLRAAASTARAARPLDSLDPRNE